MEAVYPVEVYLGSMVLTVSADLVEPVLSSYHPVVEPCPVSGETSAVGYMGVKVLGVLSVSIADIELPGIGGPVRIGSGEYTYFEVVACVLAVLEHLPVIHFLYNN